MLANLPAAFFSGLKVLAASEQSCTVSVPYKTFTKNPFRSTYFACLGMAAELSTGLLAMAPIYRRKPAVSMLITGMEASFQKKATGLTVFTCNDGEVIRAAIEEAIALGQPRKVRAQSVGRNQQNEVVAEFWFTWSFRRR